MPEERAVLLGISLARALVVTRDGARPRFGLATEEGQDRADPLDGAVSGKPGFEPLASPLELLVVSRVAEAPQHRDPGRRGQRVSGQCPGLVDRARGGQLLHDFRPASESGQRKPAADDLSEDRQVGQDSEPLLRSAARHTKAGDDLVEDEQCACGVTEPAQALEKAGRRRDDAHVPRDGLDDDARQPFAVPRDRRRDGVQVVVGTDDRVARDVGRHSGVAGMPNVATPEPASASNASTCPW